jgi:hypothetical protein
MKSSRRSKPKAKSLILNKRQLSGRGGAIPKKAGIQVDRPRLFRILASAGMTVYFAENSPKPQLSLTWQQILC